VIGLAEKCIFAAGAGQGRPQLGIGQRPAQRGQPANHPQHHDGKDTVDIGQLIAQSRKNPDPDHIGDDDGRRRAGGEGCAGHGGFMG